MVFTNGAFVGGGDSITTVPQLNFTTRAANGSAQWVGTLRPSVVTTIELSALASFPGATALIARWSLVANDTSAELYWLASSDGDGGDAEIITLTPSAYPTPAPDPPTLRPPSPPVPSALPLLGVRCWIVIGT